MLKVYQWERERWPEFETLGLEEDMAHEILEVLSMQFKTKLPKLSGGRPYGRADYSPYEQRIRVFLPAIHFGVLLHEFSHHLTWHRHRARGHGKLFRESLCEVFEWSKGHLLSIGTREPWDTSGMKSRSCNKTEYVRV